jgi:hypothetical protein
MESEYTHPGSDSDLVSDQRAIALINLTPIVDQVATAPSPDPVQARLSDFEPTLFTLWKCIAAGRAP